MSKIPYDAEVAVKALRARIRAQQEEDPVAICCIERWKPGMAIYVEQGCAACETALDNLAQQGEPREPLGWVVCGWDKDGSPLLFTTGPSTFERVSRIRDQYEREGVPGYKDFTYTVEPVGHQSPEEEV